MDIFKSFRYASSRETNVQVPLVSELRSWKLHEWVYHFLSSRTYADIVVEVEYSKPISVDYAGAPKGHSDGALRGGMTLLKTQTIHWSHQL